MAQVWFFHREPAPAKTYSNDVGDILLAQVPTLFPHLRQTGLPPAPKNQGTCAKSGINHVLWVPPTDLWKQKRGLRSRKGDDGQEKPVKSFTQKEGYPDIGVENYLHRPYLTALTSA